MKRLWNEKVLSIIHGTIAWKIYTFKFDYKYIRTESLGYNINQIKHITGENYNKDSKLIFG
jgi:hypothetical protein